MSQRTCMVCGVLLSDSAGNNKLIALHYLLQLAQVVHVVHLTAKFEAVDQTHTTHSKKCAYASCLYILHLCVYNMAEVYFGADLISGLKKMRTVLMNMVGWTM